MEPSQRRALIVAFTLPSSTYATMLIREVMKGGEEGGDGGIAAEKRKQQLLKEAGMDAASLQLQASHNAAEAEAQHEEKQGEQKEEEGGEEKMAEEQEDAVACNEKVASTQ